MNTFTTLQDAFEELERQADAYAADAARPADAPLAGRRRVRPQRLMLVAATVLVVAALAAGFGLLAGHRSASTPAGSATRASLPTRPATSVPPSTVTPSHVAAPPAAFPRDAAAVAATLRTVLGSSTTFTWSAPAGASASVIAGVLTVPGTGRRGGFDLQTLVGNPGDTAVCEDAALSHCTPRTLPDGTSVAVGQETGNGILYLVNVVRPNGATLVMHVSTNSNPKNSGHSLGTVPPMTTDQIVTLLRSPLWHAN